MAEPANPKEYRHTFRIAAKPERVFTALTDPKELEKWFAEHVSIEPKPGGRFDFWGKHTLWGLPESSAAQKITAYDPPRRLGFTWELKGKPTTVTFTLSEKGAATEVTLIHDLSAFAGDRWHWYLLSDHWHLALPNLLYFVETGQPAYRVDFSKARGNVRLDIDIIASAEKIFQSLTVPQEMDKWLSEKAEVELKVGGRYSFGWTIIVDGKKVPGGPTTITEIIPNRRLVHGWYWPGEDTGSTEVTWQLESRGKKTVVQLKHTGFVADRDGTDYYQGWSAFLCRLKYLLERGKSWE